MGRANRNNLLIFALAFSTRGQVNFECITSWVITLLNIALLSKVVELVNQNAILKHWEGQKGHPFRVQIFASLGVERDSSLIIVAYGTWIWPISELKAVKFFFFWLKATKFWPSSVDGSYCWTFYFVLYTYSLFSVIYYIETLQLKMTPIPSLVSNNSAKLQSSIEYNNSTK